MKIVKYSKIYDIYKIKESFYLDNLKNLNNTKKINKLYSSQPKRKQCKNCSSKSLVSFLINHNVGYSICEKCEHLNGNHVDTDKFVNWLYFSQKGSNYSKNYLNSFDQRVKKIYLPKVKFLKQVIKKKINVIDCGSGGGHFLKALENNKITATGYEPNKSLVDLSNKKLLKNKNNHISMNEIYKVLETDKSANIVSLMGVLEHLTDPNKLIKSFVKSNKEYLYILVPMFSLSTFLENSFKGVFPRSLAGGHTHLYSEKSLNYMAKKNNLEIIGEWWFGADMPDLFRSLMTSSTVTKKKIYDKFLDKKLFSVINELQGVLDKKKICSEVHMIFKKK